MQGDVPSYEQCNFQRSLQGMLSCQMIRVPNKRLRLFVEQTAIMQTLHPLVPVSMVITTLVTLYFLYAAARSSRAVLVISLGWLILQGAISASAFYTVTLGIPPRFVFLIAPPLLLCITLLVGREGRKLLDKMDTARLTILHVVRVPVELILLSLSLHGSVPELMTFEGRNFDIVSGLSAPLIYYYGYVRKRLNRSILIAWNITCLLLLINIVVNAVLAAPFSFQALAFDQPNIAVLYFPFTWLPGFIVPVVLLSHLACLRQLIAQTRSGAAKEGKEKLL